MKRYALVMFIFALYVACMPAPSVKRSTKVNKERINFCIEYIKTNNSYDVIYDSSTTIADKELLCFSCRAVPKSILFAIYIDSMNKAYNVRDRELFDYVISKYGFRLRSVNDVRNYLNYYYSNTDYNKRYLDTLKKEENHIFPYGAFVENVEEVKKAISDEYFISNKMGDSLKQLLPPLGIFTVIATNDEFEVQGNFIDVRLLKLYSIKMAVSTTGVIRRNKADELFNLKAIYPDLLPIIND